jgi:hypothetical protein
VRLPSLILLLVLPALALGEGLPENAVKYAPVLKQELETKWPGIGPKSYFAAQVEQETCVSLKSKKCWSPSAELKTSREYGFGLGQLTVTERFNAFDDVKKLDKELAAWKWENRYDATYQLKALVVYDKSIYTKLPAPIQEKFPFMFAAYNGGMGGILKDRKFCQGTANCNPNLWWGNVENTSFKSKTKPKGYGKSFFEINREYPKNIMMIRSPKYRSIMDSLG